jgi:hypothetical protein
MSCGICNCSGEERALLNGWVIHSNGGVSHTRFGSARLVGSWVSLNSVMYIRTLVVHSFRRRRLTSLSNTLLWSCVHKIIVDLVSL